MCAVRTMYQKYVFGLSFLLGQDQGFLLEYTIILVTLLGNTPRKVKHVRWLKFRNSLFLHIDFLKIALIEKVYI